MLNSSPHPSRTKHQNCALGWPRFVVRISVRCDHLWNVDSSPLIPFLTYRLRCFCTRSGHRSPFTPMSSSLHHYGLSYIHVKMERYCSGVELSILSLNFSPHCHWLGLSRVVGLPCSTVLTACRWPITYGTYSGSHRGVLDRFQLCSRFGIS
jgi:hypothetical protein